ncbi:SnoaL-like domain-containing protein [Mycolicibacterium rutilum]|uniref:SnoaL-like domain-containing protein n=1 Tax=Mycolicibacterium rutilum TaxID=370526 RepID=A0A1H6M7M3_MYCRU|nr:nuclear transport factor 2 family protein [Mycolicibacterium rutilum]SEH93390.1 SnoaL-like domain-containing protein [Mycolicibacterium rutilum]
MPTPDAHRFADDWVRAWNAHDVEAVLAHFHDDVLFTSPVAARVLPETGGVVRGKDALRRYWTTALQGLPDLHFEVVDVYRGESTLVIHYRNQRGDLVNEVLIFDADGQVREGHGTYCPSAVSPSR